MPGPLGAHNWQAMSVDVDAGLVYLPVQDIPFLYAMEEGWKKPGCTSGARASGTGASRWKRSRA